MELVKRSSMPKHYIKILWLKLDQTSLNQFNPTELVTIHDIAKLRVISGCLELYGHHKSPRNVIQKLKIYLEVSLLVKIDFELDFSALFDLVRKSKISIAITITFPDTHSIVTFRVSNWFFSVFTNIYLT